MGKARHNFSERVIKALERRVNGRCSNPGHRVPTSGPSSDPESANSLGIAAHICAAAPGGPRYSPAMTRAERSGIGNAIWLCANCSAMVDKDPVLYPVELLRRWKLDSERLAGEELGKTPVSRASYDALHSAVLGTLDAAKVPGAVSEFNRLATGKLESLDPRFSVEMDFANGQPVFVCKAKQHVPLKIKVAPESEGEFAMKLESLLRHGTDLAMDGGAIRIEGSPLFSMKPSEDVAVVFSSGARRNATMRFGSAGKKGLSFGLGEISGEVVGGTDSFTFKGKAFGGIISIECTCLTDGSKSSMSLEIDLQAWAGKSIHALPYFERVHEVYCSMYGQESVAICMDAGGFELARGVGSMSEPSESGGSFAAVLRHLRNVRYLFSVLRADAVFEEGAVITRDDMEFAEHVYQKVHEHEGLEGREIGSQLLSFTPGENVRQDGIEKFLASSRGAFRIVEELEYPGQMFGKKIGPVLLEITYSKVDVSRPDGEVPTESGDACRLVLRPLDGCKVHVALAAGRLD